MLETARLVNLQKLEVDALIDTGATTTSMDARNIRMYVNRQGKRWVYYDFEHKRSGKTVSMHQPVSRVAYVLTHKGPPAERAVVKNTIAIGDTLRFLEVSLINRNKFPQQLLIGRNYLTDTALVDSGAKHLRDK
ncbi:putative ATP-dependent zinc protease [Spongorhabdus nitratireducens]